MEVLTGILYLPGRFYSPIIGRNFTLEEILKVVEVNTDSSEIMGLVDQLQYQFGAVTLDTSGHITVISPNDTAAVEAVLCMTLGEERSVVQSGM